MDQTHPDRAAVASPSGSPPQQSVSPRSGLWRAVAGMAIALALAAAIVTVDLSHELVERMAHYRSRIASLNQRVDTLKREAKADEKRLADARAEIKQRKLMESRDRIKAITLAPDRKTIKLISPIAGAAAGTSTISAKMNGGVLNAHGLAAPPDGQVYDAWWMLKDAPAAKAAEFRSDADGGVNEYLDPPPQASTPISLTVTLEPSEGGIAPSGPMKLVGKAPVGIVEEERSGGAKKH
jgi:hypothetical protein